MATISRPYRLVNPSWRKTVKGIKTARRKMGMKDWKFPSRRKQVWKDERRSMKRNPKKRMTLKQKLHFGTARQRAAARVALRGRKRNSSYGRHARYEAKQRRQGITKPTHSAQLRYKERMESERYERRGNRSRRKNVGSILTVFNPGYKERKKGKKRMARVSKKRHLAGLKAARTRRRRGNPGFRRRRRNVVARRSYRRRRSNPVVRHRRRSYARRNRSYRHRRNPAIMQGTAGKVIGVIGGAAVTKLLTETLAGTVTAVGSGFPLYIAGAVIAFLQGKLVSKFTHNSSLGDNMAVGGYTYVALKALTDLLPSIPLPFGVSGLGLITSSNQWGPPWVNVPGANMTRYVKPGGLPLMVAPPAGGTSGFGRVRRMGRLA